MVAQGGSQLQEGGGISLGGTIEGFTLGIQGERNYNRSTAQFHRSFNEFSTKAAAEVDRRFDISVDVKSEATESTRATRRIRNLNQCQTVTYHYFQLARRYETTLTVVDVRFDVAEERPPVVFTTP